MKLFALSLLVFCFTFQIAAQDEPTTEDNAQKMPELVMVFTKT